MLEVCAVAAVFRYCRPLILEHSRAGFADVDHWFNGQNHALAQPVALPTCPEIRDLRVLVHPRSDAVAHELPHYAEAIGFHVLLHSRPDVANGLAQLDFTDGFFE